MLESQRLILRPIKSSDCSFFFKWLNDPKIINNLGFYLPITEMAEQKWIESYGPTKNPSEVMFVIETIDECKIVGFCVLGKINHKDQNAEFTIVIGEIDQWSKGFGNEAGKTIIKYGFDQLNLHRIYTGAYSFNEASIKMLERIGFKKEGLQRQAVYKNGEFKDVITFGLLRTDFN